MRYIEVPILILWYRVIININNRNNIAQAVTRFFPVATFNSFNSSQLPPARAFQSLRCKLSRSKQAYILWDIINVPIKRGFKYYCCYNHFNKDRHWVTKNLRNVTPWTTKLNYIAKDGMRICTSRRLELSTKQSHSSSESTTNINDEPYWLKM